MIKKCYSSKNKVNSEVKTSKLFFFFFFLYSYGSAMAISVANKYYLFEYFREINPELPSLSWLMRHTKID